MDASGSVTAVSAVLIREPSGGMVVVLQGDIRGLDARRR
jgi:hypothetical protein